MQQLKSGALLQGGKYKIERVLGQGGFGITYLATQELLNRKVAIKEFFYKEFCERNEETSHVTLGTTSNRELVERFMEKFIKEARTISTLNHPHIIRIYDIFKENNTAYYVMEYIEGTSLAEMVKRQGALPEDVAIDYIKQTASALEFVHRHSINHLDVKPANIMVRKEDNQTVLIDFGLSKQYDASGEQTSTTPVGISHGYAPMEQYNVGGVGTFSPQTDIYSLGATLYKLVTGNTPPQAGEVLNEGLPELPSFVSSSVADVIKKAMQPRKVERYNYIKEFVGALNQFTESDDEEETIFIQQTTDEKRPKSTPTNENKKSKSSHNIIIICVIALLVGLGILVIPKNNNEATSNNASKTVKEIYDEAMTYYSSKEYIKAIPLFEQAANMGDAAAQNQLGYCYALGDGVEKNENKAAELWMKAAEQGNADAQCNVAWCYANGSGIEKNAIASFEWYSKSADQGHAGAQVSLGWCYELGEGVNKDLSKAVEWYTKAAYQGNATAQYNLGNCFYEGKGVTQDLSKAFEWWQKAATLGDRKAQFMTGYCYESGEGINKDLSKAFEWYSKAANAGNSLAQRHLGWFYEEGLGTDKNPQKAFEWYSKAAQQGDSKAQYNLGYCHLNGIGVTQNAQKAFECWLIAAEHDFADAQFIVGYCYWSGEGTKKDLSKAKEWLKKASNQGNEEAKELLKEINKENDTKKISSQESTSNNSTQNSTNTIAKDIQFVVDAPTEVKTQKTFEITYTINSKDVENFKIPKFPDNIEIIAGPYKNTNDSRTNFTYVLNAKDKGKIETPQAKIIANGKLYFSETKTIYVRSDTWKYGNYELSKPSLLKYIQSNANSFMDHYAYNSQKRQQFIEAIKLISKAINQGTLSFDGYGKCTDSTGKLPKDAITLEALKYVDTIAKAMATKMDKEKND